MHGRDILHRPDRLRLQRSDTDTANQRVPAREPCQSITGGYVYRGCALPELYGQYFFAEYCTSQIWSFRYNGATKSDSIEWTTTLDPLGNIDRIPSFGQDHLGELYLCEYGGGALGQGAVYKIVQTQWSTATVI